MKEQQPFNLKVARVGLLAGAIIWGFVITSGPWIAAMDYQIRERINMLKELIIAIVLMHALSSPADAANKGTMANLIFAGPQVLGDVTQLSILGGKQCGKQCIKAFQKGRVSVKKIFAPKLPTKAVVTIEPNALTPLNKILNQ